MKVAVPDKSVYQDAAKKVTLTLFREAPPRLVAPGERYTWAERLLPPSEMLISASAKRVVYMGGLGEPGMSLGRIRLYDFAGKMLVEVDLNSDIPDLAERAKSMQEDMGNFPWIASAALSPDGNVATIDVCKTFVATLDLRTNTHKVAKR